MFCVFFDVGRTVAKNAIQMFVIMSSISGEPYARLINRKDAIHKMVEGSSVVPEEFLTQFQVPFLEHSRVFYGNLARGLLETGLLVTDYLKHIQRNLREEDHRCSMYLPPQTNIASLNTCRTAMLLDQVPFLLQRLVFSFHRFFLTRITPTKFFE